MKEPGQFPYEPEDGEGEREGGGSVTEDVKIRINCHSLTKKTPIVLPN